jgi:hypothetical protein
LLVGEQTHPLDDLLKKLSGMDLEEMRDPRGGWMFGERSDKGRPMRIVIALSLMAVP